jgi:hypothetical protein
MADINEIGTEEGSDQLAQSSDQGQPIGEVESTTGTVTHADGTQETLEVGSPVYQGDTLETSDDGSIGVVLADNTTFSMAEGGNMVLDEMGLDPATNEGSISLSAGEGVFTFVSGLIAKTDPDAMTLNTPTATIGIRGTQVGLDVAGGNSQDGGGSGATKVVLMEEGDGFVGEVVVSNAAGVKVLNQAYQSVQIINSITAPSSVFTVDHNQLLKTYGAALGSLPAIGNANRYGAEPKAAADQGEEEALGEEELSEEELAEEELAAEEELTVSVIKIFGTPEPVL